MALDNHLYFTTGYKVSYKEGDQGLYRTRLIINPTLNDKWHIIKDGETLTSIANRYYGDSQLWYLIADANSIFNPFDDILEVGATLRIPGPEIVDRFRNQLKNPLKV